MITYEWLVGTGIAIIGIISGLVIYQHGNIRSKLDSKMDKDVCKERHEEIDKALIKLDRINDAVIRVEAILNQGHKS